MPNLKNIKYTGKIHTFGSYFAYFAWYERPFYSRLVFKNCHNLTEIYLPKVSITYEGYPKNYSWSTFSYDLGASVQNLLVDSCDKLERITIAFLGKFGNNKYNDFMGHNMLYLNNLPKLTAFYSSISGTPSDWIFSNLEDKIKIDNNINCSLYLNKWSKPLDSSDYSYLERWIGKSEFGFKTIYKNW